MPFFWNQPNSFFSPKTTRKSTPYLSCNSLRCYIMLTRYLCGRKNDFFLWDEKTGSYFCFLFKRDLKWNLKFIENRYWENLNLKNPFNSGKILPSPILNNNNNMGEKKLILLIMHSLLFLKFISFLRPEARQINWANIHRTLF